MEASNVSPRTNREAWLAAIAERIMPLIEAKGGKFGSVRVSCGWPATGALRGRRGTRTLGQCWADNASDDETREIFVTPAEDNSVKVAGILAHELCHAALPHDVGHKAPFASLAYAIGLTEGKPTTASPGEELNEQLAAIVREVGGYPHAKVDRRELPPEKTRLLKAECPACGCIFRITRKWIDIGLPTCACGQQMIESDVEPDERLKNLAHRETTVEYETRDGRFVVRFVKTRRNGARWLVLDWHYDGRVTAVASKDDALSFVEALTNGDAEYADAPDPIARWVRDAIRAAGFAPWREPDQLDDEAAHDYDEPDLGELGFDEADPDHLADDEDEVHDNPGDAPDDLDEYDRETRTREGVAA